MGNILSTALKTHCGDRYVKNSLILFIQEANRCSSNSELSLLLVNQKIRSSLLLNSDVQVLAFCMFVKRKTLDTVLSRCISNELDTNTRNTI